MPKTEGALPRGLDDNCYVRVYEITGGD